MPLRANVAASVNVGLPQQQPHARESATREKQQSAVLVVLAHAPSCMHFWQLLKLHVGGVSLWSWSSWP